jgi:geranylgeranyl pyrophosphate synthase
VTPRLRRRELPALVSLLEAELAGGAYGELPRHIWETALFGPAREFLSRPGKSFRAHAVAAGWRLAGGDPAELPIELPLLVEILHAGSLIVDDIQDDSSERRGAPTLHLVVGMPVALNTGNWLYFWPMVLLSRLGLPPAVELALQRDVQHALFRCHEGQALDLAVRVDLLAQADVPAVVSVTTARKTGALFALGTRLGAAAAGGSPALVDEIGGLGQALGVALQQLDDLGGLGGRRDKGREDLLGRRPTWPWAWIAERLPPESFAPLQRRLRDLTSDQVDGLADDLARSLGDHGAATTRASLESLRERMGDPGLDALIARLEESYG